MRGMVSVAVLLCAMMAPANHRNELAHRGEVEADAPVHNTSEMVIAASDRKVWALLTDVRSWPQWQKDVSRTDAPDVVREGTEFTWVTGGTTIHSKVALMEACKRFAWTGTATAHAIHVWELRGMPDGRTLVTTRESMSGFLLSMFYSSAKLKESHERWLRAMELAAEQ